MSALAPVGQLLRSSRPVSWIDTAYPFAAAFLLAGGNGPLLVIGTLYFLVPYNLAMYGLNDVFDYESDLRNPRKGGVQGVILDRRLHRATVVAAIATNVPFLIALLAAGSPASAAALVVAVAAVIGYSVPGLRLKERPVVDSVTSATHFVAPAVFGWALAGAPVSAPAVAAFVAFFAWAMGSHAFGAVQDITADREAAISSIATALGARATVRLTLGLYALAGVAALATGWPGCLVALLAVPYLAMAAPYRNLTDERCAEANGGWRRFLWLNYACGFPLTLVLIWVAAS